MRIHTIPRKWILHPIRNDNLKCGICVSEINIQQRNNMTSEVREKSEIRLHFISHLFVAVYPRPLCV